MNRNRDALAALGRVLLPYQRRWILDESRLKVWVASRQIGKSFSIALEALWLAMKKPRDMCVILSASERQSKEVMEKIYKHVRVVQAVSPGFRLMRQTREELLLPNGSRILCLPAKPETVRGFSAHVFLDEFAFHEHPEAIWQSIYPTTTHGYLLRVISTPNGQSGMFYQLVHHVKNASVHRTTIHEAEADGLHIEGGIDALRAGVADPDAWAQEYECAFLDEASAWLTYDMIDRCERHDCLWSKPIGYFFRSGLGHARGELYLGVDVGRKRDLTVMALLEKIGDVLWLRDLHIMANAPFPAQRAALKERIGLVRRGCVDSTGLGMQLAEEAHQIKRTVEPVTFTQKTKEQMAVGLRQRFEDQTIRIPPDGVLRDDLHAVKKITTPSGNMRFDAERTDGHADRFWAIALAVHAASQSGGWSFTPRQIPRPSLLDLRGYMA